MFYKLLGELRKSLEVENMCTNTKLKLKLRDLVELSKVE